MSEINKNLIDENLKSSNQYSEELENMLSDYEKMPQCAEKILLKLYYFSMKTLMEKKEPFSLDIKSELDSLYQRLKVEELLNEKIDNLYKELKNYLTFNDHFSSTGTLKKILVQLRDLNIQLLFRLTQINDDRIKLIENKKIYLLIGLTGVGKSTTMHFLGGSKMNIVSVNGQNHIGATQVTNQYLKNVNLSGSLNSETRHIIPVLITPDESQDFGEDSVIFCDSPGFEDNNGPEIDIANSIAFKNTINICKGLKPIVVTSKLSGDRFKGLEDLSMILSSMFVNFKEALRHFAYIYTKYSPEEKQSLKNTLKNIKDTLSENKNNGKEINKSFFLIVEDMIKKSRSKFIVLDPLNDDPNYVLGQLIDGDYIENPMRTVKMSFSHDSKLKIDKQIKKHFSCVNKSILRQDYDLALFKLEEVIQLRELLNHDEINETFEEITKELFKSLSKEYDNYIGLFNEKIDRNDLLNEYDKKNYIKFLVNAREMQKIVNKIDTVKSNKYNQLVDNLNKQCKKINESIMITSPEIQTDLMIQLKIHFDNLKMIMKIWESIDHQAEKQSDVTHNEPINVYQKCCDTLKQMIENKVKTEKISLPTNDDFNNIARVLDHIHIFDNHFHEHLNDTTNHYDSIKDCIKTQFEKKIKECESILKQASLNDTEVERIFNIDFYFMAAKLCPTFQLHVSLKEIDDFYNRFMNSLRAYFDNIKNEIETQINKTDFDSNMNLNFDKIKNSLTKMKKLRENSQIELKTNDLYQYSLDSLVHLVTKINKEIEFQYNKIMSQSYHSESGNFENIYKKFAKNVKLLDKLKWVEEYKKNLYEYAHSDSQENLLYYIDDLSSNLSENSFNIEAFDQIENTYNIVKKIVDMEPLIEIYPDIKEPIEKVKQSIKKELEREFEKLNSIYRINSHDSSIDYEFTTMAISYLECIRAKNLYRKIFPTDTFTNANKNLRDFIKKRYDYLVEQLELLFDCLKNENQQQKTSSNQLIKNARCFALNLNELKSIENYPKIIAYLPKESKINDEYWPEKIRDYLEKIEFEIESLMKIRNQNELDKRLNLVKALRMLDNFVDKKFSEIFNKYSKSVRNEIKNIFDQSKKYIEEFNFERLGDNMMRLNKSDNTESAFLNDLECKLGQKVLEFSKKALNISKSLGELEKDDIQSLKENIDHIEDAKRYTLTFIDKKSQEHIERNEREIKLAVQSCVLRYLKSIKESIKHFDADEKVSILMSLKKDLIWFLDENTIKEINDLNINMTDLVMEGISHFQNVKIKNFNFYSPKNAYEKLIRSNGPNMERDKVEFKRILLEKYEAELEEAEKCEPLSLYANEHLKKIERSMKFIPDEIVNELKDLLEDTKREISKKVLNNELDFQNKIENCDFSSIESLYEEYKMKNETEHVERIKKFVNDKNNKLIQNLNQTLKEKKFKDFLFHFDCMFNLCLAFGKHVNGLEKALIVQQDSVRNLFKDLIQNTHDVLFLKNNYRSDDLLAHVSLNYQTLKEIVEMNLRNFDKNIFNSNPKNYFDNKFNNLNNQLKNTYLNCQKSFKTDLETIEVEKLEHSLDTLEFYDSLFKQNSIFLNSNSNFMHDDDKYDSTILDYDRAKEVVLTNIDNLLNDILKIQFLVINQEVKIQTQIDSFFGDINKKLIKIKKLKQHLQKHFPNTDFGQYELKCVLFLKDRANEFTRNCQTVFEKILNSETVLLKDLDEFYTNYCNLSSFNKKIDGKNSDPIDIKLLDLLMGKLNHLGKDLELKDMQIASKAFVFMKKYSNLFYIYKDQINEKINEYLNVYLKKNGGMKAIGPMALLLKSDAEGSMIVSENNLFKSYNSWLWYSKTQSKDIQKILDEIKGDIIDIDALKKNYEQFENCFKELVEKYLKPVIDFKLFISNMNINVSNIRSNDESNIKWDVTLKKRLPELIAHIFALFTLVNANKYFDTCYDDNKFIFQPHSAQVIAIFRMLGLGYKRGKADKIFDYVSEIFVAKDETLRKNIVQIGTGEGKSITLAVCAATLALLGFEVYCVSYSDFLSNRDYEAFETFFDKLGLIKHIHYGTFNKICEHLINERGDVRKMVENMIFGKNLKLDKKEKSERLKVLLIDEVDVFFSKDFYGSSYRPSLELKDATITELVTFIWKQRHTNDIYRTVKISDQYKNCCKKFPKWKDLIWEQVKEMISQSNQLETHEYEVQNDKIGYKEQDSIVFDTMYGYKTVFAYFNENEKGCISRESLDENICMLVSLGSYSYAEIPKNKFYSILGVTGTLKDLNECQNTIIKKYGINEFTYMPSVFGHSKLDTRVDIIISEDQYHIAIIVKEINNRMMGKTKDTKRAVFVVFDSKQELYKFYRSEEFRTLKENTAILTEDANLNEKTNIINNAALSGKITLMTRIFGRGTDFVVHDQIVSANGGVHVIQTFFSEELSEEIQVKGRTARQGEDGSFSLIISRLSLEKFSITEKDLEERTNLYEKLNNKRNEFFKKQYPGDISYVDMIKKKHEISTSFVSNLIENKESDVKKFILAENKGPILSVVSKTIILLDATGSMKYLLEKIKETLETMLDRVVEILNENGYDKNDFQIKIVVYRNYNSPESELLESSSWENEAQNLIGFLNFVDAKGGYRDQKNEAIEMGLWVANQEESLSQVILIGDAPANTIEQIKVRRKDFIDKKYTDVITNYINEANMLKKKNIPVHAFYVSKIALENFSQIAKITDGECKKLDIHSSKGSLDLINLVNIQLLKNIGGSVKGNTLVESYKTKYNEFRKS